jgi:alpha,alpha-trehalase
LPIFLSRRCPINALLKKHLAAQILFTVAITGAISGCRTQYPTENPPQNTSYYHPAEELGPLFHDVQMARIFPDGKTFVDMPAKSAPESIAEQYADNKSAGNFDLKAFVLQNFLQPDALPANNFPKPSDDMFAHLEALWPTLIRPADKPTNHYSTLIPLPHPYVVPGGRFREIYYWDSYFTMQGLLHGREAKMARAMVENFAWLIDHAGHIPNGNRSYYLSRSQPPFFAAMVTLLREHNLAKAGDFLPQLEKEYAFWMAGADDLSSGHNLRVVKMADGSLLNRYYDSLDTPRPESYREDIHTATLSNTANKPQVFRHLRAAAESGWDFSSRWLTPYGELPTIHTTDIIPVDLNCLLYHLELEISAQHQQLGHTTKAKQFQTLAQARKNAIQKWLWDERLSVYGDYSLHTQQLTGIASLATVYPLYFFIATENQAKRTAHILQRDFLKDGGLVTTLQATGEQWDFPNGWAPLQWLAVIGLRNYGHDNLAATVAERWLSLNQKVFKSTGRMMEKYNVVDITAPAGGGEYPTQDGFGWTNGVALAFRRLYPEDN